MIQTATIPSTATAIPVIKERQLCHVQQKITRICSDVMIKLHTYDNFTHSSIHLGR